MLFGRSEAGSGTAGATLGPGADCAEVGGDAGSCTATGAGCAGEALAASSASERLCDHHNPPPTAVAKVRPRAPPTTNNAEDDPLRGAGVGDRIETPAALVAIDPMAPGAIERAGAIDGRGVKLRS